MKKPKLLSKDFLEAIFDRRLYDREFFLDILPVTMGVIIQSIVIFFLNSFFLFGYVPSVFVLILISALGSKNIGRENQTMGYWENFFLVVSSIIASMVPVIHRFDNSLFGVFQFLTIAIFTALAFPYSIIQTSIYGHRRSLRRRTQLTKEFFKEQKEIWKDKLSNFPNNKDLLEKFDDGKYIPDLFDRGSFNLVILWSCNFMEKIIDSSIEGILSQNSEVKALFKKENDRQKSYPVKLKNLDLKKTFTLKCREAITSEFLWHSLRNDIAHRNIRPSFKETFATMCYFVTFIQEMPSILQEWRKKNFLIT